MSALHRLRQAALRLGVDLSRASAAPPARHARILRSHGIDLVLDVGANRGQYASELRRYGYADRICSFEPLPDAYRELARRAARDAGWSALNHALGSHDGTASLNVAGNAGASSSILPMLDRHLEAAPDSEYVAVVEVPVRRLDTVWDEVMGAGSAPFLKLDVQGFEGEVLHGGGRALASLKGVQLEISLVPLYANALTLRDALDRATALGMRLVNLAPGFSDPRTGELLQADAVFMRDA